MALVSREREISRDIELRDNGIIVARRVFEVWDDVPASGGSPVSPLDARNAPGLPELGDPFPGFGTLIAIRDIARRHEGDPGMVSIIWIYEGTLDTLIGEDVDIRQEFRDTWRTPPFTFQPVDGVVSNDNLTDIGGTPHDINGHPQTHAVTAITMAFSEIKVGILPTVQYAALSNRRNSKIFRGFSIGTVVYLGSRSRKLRRDMRLVTHRFVFDEFSHLKQFPQRRQDGGVSLKPSTVAPPDPDFPVRVARSVFWRQPFTRLADLNLIITP